MSVRILANQAGAGRQSRGRGRRLLAVTTAILLLCLAAVPSFAAGGLQMSTEYPGRAVKAGESPGFDLDFYNGSGAGRSVALSVLSIPKDWKGYFEGNGVRVDQVFLKSGANDDVVTFKVVIPEQAGEGTYKVMLKADGGGGFTDTLELALRIDKEDVGSSSFTVQYPEQKGSSSTTFSFSATIVNNTPSEQSYSLSADVPPGWQVGFKPSGENTQIASISVEARKSRGLKVEITPPANIEAGKYTIPCAAVSAGETLTTDLAVVITGTYKLELSTPSGRLSLDAHANRETAVDLTITNKGNVDLQNVTLTSSAPKGWSVRFEKPSIDVLKAGSTQQITAYIKPSKEAISGDYVTTITASCDETSSEANFRVTVKTTMLWGFVAVVIILALAGGLSYVFRKYGRR